MSCLRYQMLYELANGIILSFAFNSPNNGANLLALKANRSFLMDSKIGQEKMAGNDNINIQPDKVKNSTSLVSNFSVTSAYQNQSLTLSTQKESSSEDMAATLVSTKKNSEKNIKPTPLKLATPSMPTLSSREATANGILSPTSAKSNISYSKCGTGLKCDICNKKYANKSNLLKHNRIKHSEQNLVTGKILCREKNCNFRAEFFTSLELICKTNIILK